VTVSITPGKVAPRGFMRQSTLQAKSRAMAHLRWMRATLPTSAIMTSRNAI
jgi:hypothetical protein